MSTDDLSMPTKYEPQTIENGRYKWWLEGKYFEAQPESGKEPYTIVIPPPNVTGKLHLRSCLGYNTSRYFNAHETNARVRCIMASRNGPCGNRNTSTR